MSAVYLELVNIYNIIPGVSSIFRISKYLQLYSGCEFQIKIVGVKIYWSMSSPVFACNYMVVKTFKIGLKSFLW